MWLSTPPGCGGRFKESPEDFEVEEIPLYLPQGAVQGEGEHLYLWVEKRGLTTPEAARRLARHLGVSEQSVSWAGLKDRQAVTRQWLSVHAKPAAEAQLASFADPDVKVLEAKRHKNKLKGGHLAGNRFTLVLREVKDAAAAKATLDELSRRGLPNFYGEQRFGASGQNAAKGKALLLAGGRGKKSFERKLFLSALQSQLFNRVLEARLRDGLFETVRVGDVLKKHQSGGEFVCTDTAVDQPRLDAFEVSPTGPLFGPEMRAAEGEVAAAEAKVLADEGLSLEAFQAGGNETRGARRLLRVKVEAASLEADGDVVRLKFELPAGSYATVLLDELLKPG